MKLCIPTVDEAKKLIRLPSQFRDYAVCDGSLPPLVMLERAIAQFPETWCMPRMFYDEANREIVGSGAFKADPKDRRVELGYGVAPSRRCLGYATAGVMMLADEALCSGLVDEVYAEVSPANAPSRRVLQKAGFSYYALGEDDDGVVELWSKKRQPHQSVQRAGADARR